MENCKKIILVAHCLLTKRFLNLTGKNAGEIARVLLNSETGIIQMPCPHLYSLKNKNAYILTNGAASVSSDNEFSKVLKSGNAEKLYSEMAATLLIQVENYRRQHFEIAGIIGIKDSPVCGTNGYESENKCSFMNFFCKKLKNEGINISIANL